MVSAIGTETTSGDVTWLCKNSTRYDRTRNFGLYGHAESEKNLSSARHYDQIRFRFHTAKTRSGHSHLQNAGRHGPGIFAKTVSRPWRRRKTGERINRRMWPGGAGGSRDVADRGVRS
jgi:hypothetical protein